MKCSTHMDSKENKCCNCGLYIPIKQRQLRPDPYDEEINGNEDLHLQCDSCYERSSDDV